MFLTLECVYALETMSRNLEKGDELKVATVRMSASQWRQKLHTKSSSDLADFISEFCYLQEKSTLKPYVWVIY